MAAIQTDQKRQSAGNRVATPKLGPQTPADADATLGKAIGSQYGVPTPIALAETLIANMQVPTSVRLSLVNPTATLEGALFASCKINNLVAINVSQTSSTLLQPNDFHVVPVSRIQKLDILSLSPGTSFGFDASFLNTLKVDTKGTKAREEAAIRKLKEADARRGKGVGKDAQAIFDSFARLYPARWHGTDMIINDSVIIRSPYRKEDCSAPQSQQSALERIRGQLDRFAERKARSTPQPQQPAPSTPRKGG